MAKTPFSKVFFSHNVTQMKKYPAGYFDLALVDTNWGIGEAKKVLSRNRAIKHGKRALKVPKKQSYKAKDWDNRAPSTQFWNQLFRITKKRIIMGENYLNFPQKELSSGRIVWDKVNSGDFSDCEIFWTDLFTSIKLVVYMWNGMLQGESLDNPRYAQGDKSLNEERIAICQKPVLLYKKLLIDYSTPGMKILSTNVGSGSDRIACWDLNLHYEGMENDRETFNAQELRFKRHAIQAELFRNY